MITHYFRTLKDENLKEVEAVRSGVWTHAVEPTDVELEQLVRDYGLDEAIVDDARDFFEVPRMERTGSLSYFFTRYPFEQDDEDVETAPLLVVMGESFVLTIAQRPVPQFKKFLKEDSTIITTQKTKLFIHIMTAITRSFERELVRLRRSVHRDRARLRRIGNAEIARFVNYEHKLNDMISTIVPTNTWLQQVTKGNFFQMFDEDVDYMEDLMIDNSQLVESARSVLKTIQNVRSATEAILTNNLNYTIRTLTALTILLTIPTIISSFYGMNVSLPLADHPNAFWLVLVLVLMLMSLIVYYFRRNQWL